MSKLLFPLVIALGLVAILNGCTKDDPIEREKLAMSKYLEEHGYSESPKASGLYYIETKKGTGADADNGDLVKVKYKGTFTDGSVFDSGIYTFTLGTGRVIKGWDEGIGYMKEGGEAILLIPSALAYGPYGNSGIPGYSPLVFEVELIQVN